MSQRMDYDPLPGPTPSQSLAMHVDVEQQRYRQFSMPTIVVQQSIEQIDPSPSAGIDQPTMSPIGSETKAETPYGEDFTSTGMCNWDGFIAGLRQSTRRSGNKLEMMVDEFPIAADHRHKCRRCREHLGGLIQDLEGDVGVFLHGSPRNDDNE